ncbi:DMT family transporter [Planobispora longispora]|uniref:EamA domain-containing protein n=1 Tax=Planobispora longispora TaxID=28887 RepID=A0A8J3RM61_9ACTN|nr:DMT family transporter [Planobispora longispora]GIH77520.1 hypothetical protein Plo01_39490 [Planobispora longispora]
MRVLVAAIAGTGFLAASATLVRLSAVQPATAAVFRCAYAVPVLAVLALSEMRRHGPLPARRRRLAWLAGLFFSLDLILWHHSIRYVGAGIATVLGNLQVFVVSLAAWRLLRERPPPRLLAVMPPALAGVALLSGVFDASAYGSAPLAGVILGGATSLTYAAFILVFRRAVTGVPHAVTPLLHMSVTAAMASCALGPATGGVDLVPAWPGHGWLIALAFTAQIAAWLLIGYALPRQSASLTALLLLLQPVGALVLSWETLGERPSPLQLLGCGIILAAVAYATVTGRGRRKHPEADTPSEGEEEPHAP